MRLQVRRCTPRDERDAADDCEDAEDLPVRHALLERARTHEQKDEQPGCERRLHEDERRIGKREHLRADADDAEQPAEDPARPPEEAHEQRDAQAERLRRCAGFDPLQRDPDVEKDGRHECSRETKREHGLHSTGRVRRSWGSRRWPPLFQLLS